MIKNQDPRIERWMQKVADEMQRMIEQQGQERAQQDEANRKPTATGVGSPEQGRSGSTGASSSGQGQEQGDEEMREQGMQDDMPTYDPEEAEDDRRTSEEVAGDVIMLVTGSQDSKQPSKRKQVRWTDGEDKMRGQLEEY